MTTRRGLKRALSDTIDRLNAHAAALRRIEPGTPEYERALVEAERLHADVEELLLERRGSNETPAQRLRR